MKSMQPPIPGLEGPIKARVNADKKYKTFQEQLKLLQDRVLCLEMEFTILKTQLKNPPGRHEPDCYFWKDDRCLGRPADTCQWSVKVGGWEWICAYPWKGEIK